MRVIRAVLTAVAIFTVSICHASSIDDYLGAWVHVKLQKFTLSIEKNGPDGYLIRQTMPSPLNGKLETKSVPAVFKDGMLQIAGGYGALVIDRASGHLTSGNAEYRRLSDK